MKLTMTSEKYGGIKGGTIVVVGSSRDVMLGTIVFNNEKPRGGLSKGTVVKVIFELAIKSIVECLELCLF